MRNTVISASILFIIIILCVCAFASCEEYTEIHDGYIFCNPDTYINVRRGPGKQYAVCGFFGCGDSVRTDFSVIGDWIHVLDIGEADGWIMNCYLTFDEIIIFNEPVTLVTTQRSTPVRISPEGKIRKRIRNGTKVTVIAVAGEWTLTKIGYIKTELLKTEVGR